jgi:hypothetical protein
MKLFPLPLDGGSGAAYLYAIPFFFEVSHE